MVTGCSDRSPKSVDFVSISLLGVDSDVRHSFPWKLLRVLSGRPALFESCRYLRHFLLRLAELA